jgi:superfamily II DNA or RNA helicase
LIGTLLGSPNRRKVIVFFERIASAEDGAAILELEAAKIFQDAIATVGLWTGVLHSELKDVERRRVIDEFRSNARGVLFVCRMLDEGFDVPDVDAAVLVASTKSKRQRVQRIGRVLRRGDGQKQPVVLTLFCEQTTDQFVVAADRELFGEDTTIETVTAAQAREFLQGHRRERKHGGV